MNWLFQTFSEQSIAWLLISSAVALASGFLASWLTYRFIKRQEIIDQAKVQGDIRKEVEAYLGDKSAEREYNLEARKRLYHVIGPLRFQLVIACRDVVSRIMLYGFDQSYSMTMRKYYGRNTLYRLLRPLAISELIEQQITYADFSVDLASIGLLRYKKAAHMAFSDGDTVLNHPKANWNFQEEHLFSGTVSNLANSIIIRDDEAAIKKRPMHFHEFEAFIRDPENMKLVSPLANILDDFNIKDKPIFWARLVCFGYIFNVHIEQAGKDIGFENHPFDLEKLLMLSSDEYITNNIENYLSVFHSLPTIQL